MLNIYQILIISLFHIIIINSYEKILIQIYYKTINRPYINDKNNYEKLESLGMPSGHAEAITIIMILLYFYNYVNLNIVLFIIIFVCLQRILTLRHTLNQVLIGCLIGLFMSLIYFKLNSFIYSLIFIFIYIFLSIFLLLKKIDYHINNEPTPEWVDKSLYKIIEHKKKTSYINKIINLNILFYKKNPILFCSWRKLEKNLDIIIEKIKDKKIDIIIGIKTGGAILTKYISNKLNLEYDYIKMSYDINKCTKTPNQEIYFHIIKNIKNFDDFICEDIKINVKNKNILLIDELIATGKTTNYIKKYLIEKKLAKNVIVACISSYLNDVNVIKSTDNNYIFWPWGYDN